MVELPDDSPIASKTPYSALLNRMLSNFSTSYKLFWFKGIFEEVVSGDTDFSFRRIVARMIASAWYPVIFFKLNLGTSDKLADAVYYIRDTFPIEPSAPESELIELIEQANDSHLNARINNLTSYVPYRLIRPIYEDKIEEVKRCTEFFSEAKVNSIIRDFNLADSTDALYAFDVDGKSLHVDEGWYNYLRCNEAVIRGWLDCRLIDYLQARNPSVPAISKKIYPPIARDLRKATEYWRSVIGLIPIHDLYTGLEFNSSNFESHGALSIDHFIPWSFVLHDEPWNLTPAFKNVNSSKSDKLPELETYLPMFCLQQFDAFLAARTLPGLVHYCESYLDIDVNAMAYTDNESSRAAFCESVTETVTPLYQIAHNQGYAEWSYIEF